ncbi:glycoside hydrolase family 128 protein [Dissoconium aciculare CBS 342.82]|uniref:Glycoside hydrolase family 128 protein n=1 Tax=Dissoconium aciculare CBS 342.82 TaxID=1314786 RepID=A0A6J3LY24_9PEZI|nr:glycoside hydrolase family 128 protein [Dissoconium aciculare CBS 342.82]KAF1820660.1 glycoside hydrolase family 128 protein [Dissoconium aciculare CBS 342.82]
MYTLNIMRRIPKRGLCYVEPKDGNDNNFWSSGDLTWYYNYLSTPTAALQKTNLQFVPMLWGAQIGNTDMSFYNSVKQQIQGGAKIPYVLGFNEPDGCANGGSCVDAQTAAETWIRQMEPLKKEFNISLGAPAVTSAPTGFNWLRNFFDQCAGRCNPDFIPVHYYGSFEGLASHMGQVNATYPNMTMWITEFADPGVTLQQSQTFYNQSVEYFERQPYLTHYAWFGAFRSSVSNVGPNAAFLTGNGQLTDIGAWYLGRRATGNVPTTNGATRHSSAFVGSIGVVLAAALYGLA